MRSNPCMQSKKGRKKKLESVSSRMMMMMMMMIVVEVEEVGFLGLRLHHLDSYVILSSTDLLFCNALTE